MGPPTERFEMRLDNEIIERIDAWRQTGNEALSRAEAMRRLVDRGLSTNDADRVHLSQGERLITLMLCDVMKRLKGRGDFDPEFIESALMRGHNWALKWQYSGVFDVTPDHNSTLTETVDILDMWSFLEEGFEKLSDSEKSRVAKEAEPFGRDVKFIGFDGNNESEHMGIAHFLVEDMNRFSRFKNRSFNSHSHSLTQYRRMLNIFLPLRMTLIGRSLSATEIINILNARRMS